MVTGSPGNQGIAERGDWESTGDEPQPLAHGETQDAKSESQRTPRFPLCALSKIPNPKSEIVCSPPHATPSPTACSSTGLGTTTPRTAQARPTVRVRPPRSFSTLPSTTRGRPEVMSEPKRA